MSITPTWQGEVQFRRYSDTSTQGQQVVFALEDREALAPFIGKEGKRFMAVLVEIGDDEQPVQPSQNQKARGGLLSQWAAMRCGEPQFREWLFAQFPSIRVPKGLPSEEAADVIRLVCGVESRTQLDHDQSAADVFHKRIRGPWQKHCIATSVTA